MSCCNDKPVEVIRTYKQLLSISTQVAEGTIDYPERLVDVSGHRFRAYRAFGVEDPFASLPYQVYTSFTNDRVITMRINTRGNHPDYRLGPVVSQLTFDLDAKTYTVQHYEKVDYHAIELLVTLELGPDVPKTFNKVQDRVYKILTPDGYNDARRDYLDGSVDVETPPWDELPGVLVVADEYASPDVWVPKANLGKLTCPM